jgi:Lsr2
MATVTRTYLVDDLDGSEEDVSSVSFSLDKTDYEIDLSAANAARLRDKLAEFVDVATGVRPGRGRTARGAVEPAPVGREQTHAIREWARNNGYEVSERGRISAALQKAFNEAH